MHRPRATAVTASILFTALCAVVATAGPAAAGPRPRVGPHQVFAGLVNGSRGVKEPVPIFVDCHPGDTAGHPVGGQSVEIVSSVASAVPGSDVGATGDAATSIEAFFGAPPPARAAALRTTVTFRRYDLVRPIPPAVVLPCSGHGQVTFVPFPRTPPTSKPAVVAVTYFVKP